MLTADVTISDRVTGDIERVKKQLKNVPKEAIVEFKLLTPVRSGNARRNTTLQGNTIKANYPYAQRLDEGYSKQAPKGMTKPWEQWLQKHLDKIMKR
jgi:hypothetical protein